MSYKMRILNKSKSFKLPKSKTYKYDKTTFYKLKDSAENKSAESTDIKYYKVDIDELNDSSNEFSTNKAYLMPHRRNKWEILNDYISENLISRGGRPKLEGSTVREKVSLSENDLQDLQTVAAKLSSSKLKIARSQIAGALIRMALDQLEVDILKSHLKGIVTFSWKTNVKKANTVNLNDSIKTEIANSVVEHNRLMDQLTMLEAMPDIAVFNTGLRTELQKESKGSSFNPVIESRQCDFEYEANKYNLDFDIFYWPDGELESVKYTIKPATDFQIVLAVILDDGDELLTRIVPLYTMPGKETPLKTNNEIKSDNRFLTIFPMIITDIKDS